MKAKVFHRVNTFNKTTEEIIIDIDKIVYISPFENNTAFITLDDGSYFVVEETLDFFKKLLVSE